ELHPLNLYGKSKNDFDIWAMEQPKAPPHWAGMKFFNVYGPREHHKGRMASVVYHTYQQICATGQMKLFRAADPHYAEGGPRRDFVYVHDCISHMLHLAQYPEARGLYNSGTGTARTFIDLTRAVFHTLNLVPDIHMIDMPADLAGQYQHFTQAVMARLLATGYRTSATDLEAGVMHTIHHLRQFAQAA
ncbi:MAG: NAD-dependent epimerase/dehydratase family protein, partial [Gemmataceae bacterium]